MIKKTWGVCWMHVEYERSSLVAVLSLKIMPTSISWKEQKKSTLHEDMTPGWSHLHWAVKVNQKVLEGLEHVHRFPLFSRNVNISIWNTLELDICIPYHYIDTSNFTLWTKKHLAYVFLIISREYFDISCL